MLRRKIINSGVRGFIRDLWRIARHFMNPVRQDIKRKGKIFDKTYQIDTTNGIPAMALDVTDEEAFQAGRYEPTPIDQFLEIANEWPSNLEKFVFVDFGCGKGRTLLLAAGFPFKQIIGVEFSKKLCEIAKTNIERFKKRAAPKCSSIDIVCQDARSFLLPPEPCVLYLFYPFNQETTRECLINIEKSLALKNRQIFISYLNPVHHDLFEASARFTCIKKIENSKYIHPYYVYASKSPAE